MSEVEDLLRARELLKRCQTAINSLFETDLDLILNGDDYKELILLAKDIKAELARPVLVRHE